MSKLPVTEVKKAATAVANTVEVIEAVGKPDIGDLGKVKDALAAAKSFSEVEWAQVLPQVADMDAAEQADVAAHFKREFDLKNDTIEATIESGIDIIIQAAQAFKVLKDIADKIIKRPRG